MSGRQPGHILTEYPYRSTPAIGSRDLRGHSMSNWSSAPVGVDISGMVGDSFLFDQIVDVQGGSQDLSQSNMSFLPQYQPSVGIPGETPYDYMPPTSVGSSAYDIRRGDWQQPVIPLTGPRMDAMPSTSVIMGLAQRHLEDTQSRSTVEDPDTLCEYKQIVFSKLLESTNLDEVRSRIRDLVSTSGDMRYNEVLASAEQQRPDIAEPGLKAALKRRKNKKERPAFACILCDDALTTNDNLKSELTYFDAAVHIY